MGGSGQRSENRISSLVRRSVPSETSTLHFLHLPKRRGHCSSAECAVNSTPKLESAISSSKSSTDVTILHRPYKYHFPQGPQISSVSSSSSETNFFPPLASYTDNSKPIPRETPGMSKERSLFSNKVEPAGRKLVVASVSYLQRPTSPSVTPGGSPASSQPSTPAGLSPSPTTLFPPPPPIPTNDQIQTARNKFWTSCCGNPTVLNPEIGNGKEHQVSNVKLKFNSVSTCSRDKGR